MESLGITVDIILELFQKIQFILDYACGSMRLGRFGRISGTSVLDFYLCYTSGNLKNLDL